MKILISGVSSFLGIYTAKELLSQGHELYGIVRKESKNREKLESLRGLQLISVDMKAFSGFAREGELASGSPESLNKRDDSLNRGFSDASASVGIAAGQEGTFSEEGFALGNLLPKDLDAIIHFAWDGVGSKGRENPEIQEQNLLMSKGFYQWGLQSGVKYFLFAGSQAEYGRGSRDNPEPVSAYGKAKLSFSRYGLSGGKGEEGYSFQEQEPQMAFFDLRIFSVYGIGDHESTLVQILVQAVLAGQSMDLSPCSQMWNFMEARDLARAIAFLLEGGFGSGTYDLCGQDSRPLKDYVLEIEALGKAFLEKKEGKKAWATSLLRFGERASNAEGPVDLKPSVKDLYDRGFQEKISFSQGIEELYQYFYQKKEGEAWQRKDV